ncbi:MAG: DUF4126 domain-containing protein [Patulibacter minatonensis]
MGPATEPHSNRGTSRRAGRPGGTVRDIDASTVTALLSAFGLSGASGLNAWLPLLLVAVLGRAGWIDLDASFAELERMPVILALLALFVLDFVADKLPAVDHAMHLAGGVVHPVVGAALFESQAGGDVPLVPSLLLGAAVAGSLHAARAMARPAINGVSGGTGAPIASTMEDIAALLLTVVAFVIPALAGVVVALMLVGAVFVVRRARALVRERRRAAATPAYPQHQRRSGIEPPAGPRRR